MLFQLLLRPYSFLDDLDRFTMQQEIERETERERCNFCVHRWPAVLGEVRAAAPDPRYTVFLT